MSSMNAVPKGLKWNECKHGISGKNSPLHYIPEQVPMQNDFKWTLPDMNEQKVAILASVTPKQFLLHIHTMLHACKQMRLDVNFTKAKVALKGVNLD